MVYQVTLVNYINTYPFIEGLTGKQDSFVLDKRIPKECGEKFLTGESDFALVPVAFLPRIKHPFQIIKNYGIACHGAVHSVKLLSKLPVEMISEVSMDPHSTTSVELLKVLMQDHWGKNLKYNDLDLNNFDKSEAVLLIGDKVFQHEDQYDYQYDLGEIWRQLTGLPFVFAIWLCKESIPQDVIDEFTSRLNLGLSRIDDIIIKEQVNHSEIDLEIYLKENIKYKLDDQYLKGLDRFYELSSLNRRSYQFI